MRNTNMEDLITIYDVTPNDTLVKIGQKIGMTADEVRDFHNLNCERNGLMWFNNLVGIEKIVLPKNYKSAAQIRKENLAAIPLKMMVPDFFAQTYEVLESYESDFENKVEIAYTLDIQLKKMEKNQIKVFVASVHCYDFKKNGEKPDDKMSELSIACAKSIAPINLIISPEGKISGIFEFEKLLKTFEDKRKDLEDFFIGEVSGKYMDQFAKSLSDEKYFEKQIGSTLLYQVLFPSMIWFYKESAWKEEFYLVKNSFPINCIFNVDFIHLDEAQIQTDIKGEIQDKISLQELLKGKKFEEEPEEPVVGLVELKYTTHKNTKQMLQAEAGIALLQEGEIYRKQKILLSKI
ncbi:hypothetical protein IV494_14560 [Kaistella sp. G5-32]|uniref:LysM domain-containing protein n=1 Tax=Kaistella gelatinilytica TaxID=2787636 RepID=A0ABS0FFC1_9FLAO|nr:hypothetical protein [Kaistella gelatinilytica]MBF8458403.1 hypothetical protein [Kaistella gelatinilytica]